MAKNKIVSGSDVEELIEKLILSTLGEDLTDLKNLLMAEDAMYNLQKFRIKTPGLRGGLFYLFFLSVLSFFNFSPSEAALKVTFAPAALPGRPRQGSEPPMVLCHRWFVAPELGIWESISSTTIHKHVINGPPGS